MVPDEFKSCPTCGIDHPAAACPSVDDPDAELGPEDAPPGRAEPDDPPGEH